MDETLLAESHGCDYGRCTEIMDILVSLEDLIMSYEYDRMTGCSTTRFSRKPNLMCHIGTLEAGIEAGPPELFELILRAVCLVRTP